MENNSIKGKVQVLRMIYLANFVSGLIFLFMSLKEHDFKLKMDFKDFENYQMYFSFLSVLIFIAALISMFVVKPMLKLIKETNEPHLETKLTKIQGPFIIYQTVWEFIVLASCVIIYTSGEAYPLFSIIIAWVMMYFAFPSISNFIKYGKLNKEEQKELTADMSKEGS